MESTSVLIVGAGPSGLVLGALLGRMNIKVVILEKETEVCEYPRGIVVNGDAVRISYQVGIGEGLTKKIGHDLGALHFHRGNFRQRPFMIFDLMTDWAEHGVSQNIAQFQLNYEREIRAFIEIITNCTLWTGCEVISRNEEDGGITTVEYKTLQGTHKYIQTQWLVGADGKRGVVRKKFLEPEGVKQVDAVWPYVGTWVGINLHVDLPTPQTHPEFPLWELGYKPEQVHEIFWPKGFHFCNDSKRPAVSGRFGPAGARFWRHEYSIEPHIESQEPLEGFWSQFYPWMVIPGSKFSRKLKGISVAYPKDCIQVLRCRPFRFATKIVNWWFIRNTMLIGDAAHVFPPFGGQGIATGIRDAQALGWRLAIMTRLRVSPQVQTKIMNGWSKERRHAWEMATLSTKLNGSIVNQKSFWSGLVYRICMRVLWWIPGGAKWRTRRAFRDKLVYTEQSYPDSFFLQKAGGGRKIAQVWVHSNPKSQPQLSDDVLIKDLSRLSIVMLVKSAQDFKPAAIEETVQKVGLHEELLRREDITYLDLTREAIKGSNAIYRPSTLEDLEKCGISTLKGFNKDAIQNRLQSSAKDLILRPDFFIHSVASDLNELHVNLQAVKEYFSF